MEHVVEIPGDEAGRQVACRDAKAIRVDRVRRKEPLLNGSGELELLLRELRFLQSFDTLAQTPFERPEKIKREPDTEAERAGDGEGDAYIARGKDNPGEARAPRNERGDPPAERASEEEDDRGHERARKNAAPVDWLAHEREQRV